ncbi:MAG: ATP-grasp domain-containing protein, partial [Spirochaetaceae bacterium]|nr:ATP-grasp domain-containing protein [Spirochaetaceae bacterium]
TYSSSNRALVETWMEGPEYSLDALVEDGRLIPCGLADRHIFHPPYFIETGHTIPSALAEEDADRIWSVFEKGVKALGLTRGAAKGDIKLTPTGPMIGEIAGRLSGGYMSGWTYPYSSGIESTRGALRLAAGLSSSLSRPSVSLVCAERALIGIDGTIRCLDGREEALSLQGVREVFLRYEPGMPHRFPRNNVEKAGNVIALGETLHVAEERACAGLRALNLELDPRDMATGVFLDSQVTFPPDAFDITGEGKLHSFLTQLWDAQVPRPSRGRSGNPIGKAVIPLPPASSIVDYTGRSIAGVLDILVSEGHIQHSGIVDDVVLSDFWKALIRGGLPGGRWYLEHSS